MTDSTALDSFLEKWRSRWPEWQVAETFVPVGQRQRVVAWFALLQEFEDAMNIAGETLPADAKLGWWAEELRDWSRRRSRHPLGRLLEPCDAPWQILAEALPVLRLARARPASADAALATLRPLADAVVAVEAALFGEAKPAAPAARAVLAQVLASRLFEAGIGAVPLDTAGDDAAAQHYWADALVAAWPARAGGTLPRRIWSALARSRLQRFEGVGQGVRPSSRLRLLWLAWRAAVRG